MFKVNAHALQYNNACTKVFKNDKIIKIGFV